MSISPEKRRYFEGEELAASDTDSPANLNPAYPPDARVLCVGCGGGWAGEAEGTSRFVGVDIDPEAGAFRKERNRGDSFCLASGERLPFRDREFTFYVARVSVMYMDLRRCLPEAQRVLGDGGELWVTCHDFRHEWTHLVRCVRALQVRGAVFRAYVILNGLLYHCFGALVRYPLNRRRMESFQSRGGMLRGLARAGFTDIRFPPTPHGQFLVTARKRG